MDKTKHSIIKRVAFIGNYQPRQCGIATTPRQAAAATVCIQTGRTRIKAQNPLSPFSSRFWNYD